MCRMGFQHEIIISIEPKLLILEYQSISKIFSNIENNNNLPDNKDFGLFISQNSLGDNFMDRRSFLSFWRALQRLPFLFKPLEKPDNSKLIVILLRGGLDGPGSISFGDPYLEREGDLVDENDFKKLEMVFWYPQL